MELCVWHVGQVGASAVGDELLVIGAPGDQRRGATRWKRSDRRSISSLYWVEEVGNPCSKSIVGAPGSPASRETPRRHRPRPCDTRSSELLSSRNKRESGLDEPVVPDSSSLAIAASSSAGGAMVPRVVSRTFRRSFHLAGRWCFTSGEARPRGPLRVFTRGGRAVLRGSRGWRGRAGCRARRGASCVRARRRGGLQRRCRARRGPA